MFGHQFYHDTTRKYIILLGTLFNEIYITRTDANNAVVQSIKVPLSYANKDKMLARVLQDPDLDKETSIVLPRMSFYFDQYVYDSSRKLNTLNVVARKDDTNPNKFKTQYQAVPYNFPFKLYIYTKLNEDATKIIEQILPFFKPDWTAPINILPEMNVVLDVAIVCNSVTSQEIPYEGDLTKRRALIWELDFTLKGWLFGPIKKRNVIKFSNTNFYFGNPTENTQTDIVSSVQVTPGMFANGVPTTNATASISPLLIEVDDDWDYAIRQSGLVIVQE